MAMRMMRMTAQLARCTRTRHTLAVDGARMLSTHVSVIGLHWKTDEVRLREAFNTYGELEKAAIITPAHSSTHLWAHLVYADFEQALEAVSEMNGQELDGRLLRVSITDPPSEEDDEVEDDD